MTPEETRDTLISLGWTPHPSSRIYGELYALESAARVEGPDCRCNDRPPTVHALIYPPAQVGPTMLPGRTVFRIFGEGSAGTWIKLTIEPEGFGSESIPDVMATAGRLWCAFNNTPETT